MFLVSRQCLINPSSKYCINILAILLEMGNPIAMPFGGCYILPEKLEVILEYNSLH
jgi:hypothetical protein